MNEFMTTSFWHTDAVGGRPHHQPQAFVVARKSSDSVSQNKRHGVWVPAFAGTTIARAVEQSARQLLQQQIKRRSRKHMHVGEPVGAAGFEGDRGLIETCDRDAGMAGGVAIAVAG